MSNSISISTKKGDDGTSSIIGSQRMSKDSAIFECLGTIDELSSHLGLVVASLDEQKLLPSLSKDLIIIQQTLFIIGAELAGAKKKLTKQDLVDLEEKSELLQSQLKQDWLAEFVLPGGSVVGAYVDIARTVTRRLERLLVKLKREQKLNVIILQYINRLSDYLFVVKYLVNEKMKKNARVVDK